ncbi:MAG: oxidative damage protection protein [Thermomicrobiales bacterium]|nr:oxidative damage protection protein [Thermomicrobiales bacterium]MCO5225940.1 oxidative damage protection protein [Thermomicrobiales bacterium]MCO5227697.1 oxidative damage protection protein [Thermomicrobiales bacterium]
MSRTVHCAKLDKDLPGLEEPPFPGALGERIFESVSAEAYAMWQPYLTTIINHYGLNPADPETRKMLRKEMDAFFFGEQNLDSDNLSPDTVQQ